MSANHLKASEIAQHDVEIADIRRRAREWRLMDCEDEVLEQMRRNLFVELGNVEQELKRADEHFRLYVEKGRPLETERAQQAVERLSLEWDQLNARLQEVKEVLLERSLRARLARLLRGERRVALLDGAVLVSILVVVGFIFAELLFALPDHVIRWLFYADTAICGFLLTDFFLRLGLAQDKGWYWRRYWIDFVSSIPFYSVLRFGRLVRIARFVRFTRATRIASTLRLLRLSRAFRVLLFAFRGLDKLFRTFQVNLLRRTVVIALVLLIAGALLISAFEGPGEASLQEFSESMWWTFTTIVTGGFADLHNPGTASGRAVTVGLVLLGLTITGIFTASLTSVLVEDDSARIEQQQRDLREQLGVINQKLNLMSGKTNEGLIALETVAQALSNQTSHEGIAGVLARTLVDDFASLQASVHLLAPDRQSLARLAHLGSDEVAPPETVGLGEGLVGRVAAELLAEEAVAEIDLEPHTELAVEVQGMAMACPLVAGQRVLGVLHTVLPDDLARYYLYNRVPMTLAHHAAMAFLAADLLRRAPHPGSSTAG